MLAHQKPSAKEEAKALCAELFGTFALTFVGVGAAALAKSGTEVDFAARVAAPGLIVMAVVYAMGKISGAHINPAVTVAFAVRRAFTWRRVPGYIVAQFAGAVLAALTLQYLLSGHEPLGATLPHVTSLRAVIMEAILTFFLMTVIVSTAIGSKIVGSNAGIAVGGTVSLCCIVGATISSAAMNPGLAFGSLLVAGRLDVYWIYVAGPIAGATTAVLFNYVTQGKPTKHELETASGEAEKAK